MVVKVVTHSSWKAEFLGGVQDFGLDIPSSVGMTAGVDGFWCPGHFASLMYANGDLWRFTDCEWWTWTDRAVLYKYERDVADRIGTGRMFVKLARHKLDSFPARVMDRDEFLATAKPGHEWLVSPVLDLKREWRVILIDGTVAASSCYRAGDWWWDGEDPGIDFPHAEFAVEFSGFPGTRVIDVGELADGSPVLIEGNPAWCAGWYGMPREPVVEAIVASQSDPGSPRFVPDSAVMKDALAAVARRVRLSPPERRAPRP